MKATTQFLFKPLTYTLPFLIILLTAFQCRSSLVRLMASMDVSITPNPVVMSGDHGQFDFSCIIPPNKDFKKVDSIAFVFRVDGQAEPLASTVLKIEGPKAHKKRFEYAKTLEFTYAMQQDTLELFLQVEAYKSGYTKTSPRIPVTYLIRDRDQ